MSRLRRAHVFLEDAVVRGTDALLGHPDPKADLMMKIVDKVLQRAGFPKAKFKVLDPAILTRPGYRISMILEETQPLVLKFYYLPKSAFDHDPTAVKRCFSALVRAFTPVIGAEAARSCFRMDGRGVGYGLIQVPSDKQLHKLKKALLKR